MSNSRSYLDTMNAGRRRRASTSLEALSESLNALESRIRDGLAGRDGDGGRDLAQRGSPAPSPRGPEPRRQGLDDLKGLRADLRSEFDTLRGDLEHAITTSAPRHVLESLASEVERLSQMVSRIAERSDDRQINLMRLEIEELKGAITKLAREETVQSVDRRWEELDRRWTDIATQLGQPGDRDAGSRELTERLEAIAGAVDRLPDSVMMRSLEANLKGLAAAVDQFVGQGRQDAGAFEAIERRLDELSRAVVASSSAAPAAFDPEPLERIEARITALARQLADAPDERFEQDMLAQMEALSRRIDDLSARLDVPQGAIDQVARQVEQISRRLDEAPSSVVMDPLLRDLESRFVSLVDLLETRHAETMRHGEDLYRDLETRLSGMTASGPAARDAAGDESLLMAMDARFAELSTRLEQRAATQDDDAIRALGSRLDRLSTKLESSTAMPVIDVDLIRGLEAQVAELAAQISRPGSSADAMAPRLDRIEQSLAGSREDVVRVAREAAEQAVRTFAGSPGDSEMVAGLVDDLKALEALTRRSDERNAKTFEAIHDTLIKIVERLGSMEAGASAGIADEPPQAAGRRGLGAPSLDAELDGLPLEANPTNAGRSHRTAASAAAQAAAAAVKSDDRSGEAVEAPGRFSMLGGLGRAISARRAKPASEPVVTEGTIASAAPAVELDGESDPVVTNQPLEPGSGAPDLSSIMRRVRDERGQTGKTAETDAAKADFIAAARRAAQAAAAEADMAKRRPAASGKKGKFSVGGLLKQRKPLLMGVAAVLIALAALQSGLSFMRSGDEVATVETPAQSTAPVATTAITEQTTASLEDVKAPADNMETSTAAFAAPDVASSRSLMAQAPATASDVSTDWLEAEVAEPAQETVSEEAAFAGDEPFVEAEAVAAELPDVRDAEPLDVPQVAAVEVPTEAGPAALREAASGGDPKALFEIGNRYAQGRGVEEDMAKAATWYEDAAEAGLAPAQYRIGNLYEKGVGVERDVARAKTWYQLAAAQGNASAMHNLAVLFAMGADGTTDNESAARWFREAADYGVRDSQFNMGILAAKGVGMEQDLEEAYKWFAIVAKGGDKDAAAKRDEVANALRPEQLEKARATTELWQARQVEVEANEVVIPESWSEGPEATASIDMRAALRNIQTILNKHGYDAGAEDGVMGARTAQAIAAFQQAKGMEATGQVDEPLVRALLALEQGA